MDNKKYYSHLRVLNYRCFKDGVELKFAQPKNGELGSGITYIVGANNTGKTTLIETLWLDEHDYIRESDKHEKPARIEFYKGSALVQALTLNNNSSQFKKEVEQEIVPSFNFVSSKRDWNSIIEDTKPEDIIKIIPNQTNQRGNPREQEELKFANSLENIARSGRKDVVTNMIKKVFPEFNDWSIGYDGQNKYIQYIADGYSHKSDLLGSGVISVLRILATIEYEESNNESNVTPIVIDEPEQSLHPEAQRRLLKVLAEESQRTQIVISTHSPYFIDWEYIQNGAILNKINKIKNTNSTINTVTYNENFKKLCNAHNWEQPYFFDIVAKEIFFHDNILFLEGQQDVGLLKAYFEDTNINIFGYGVRGYRNFQFAFRLAKDLGISKAACLIDACLNHNNIPNENNEANVLELEYKDRGYRIFRSKHEDIRDKQCSCCKKTSKLGYFNEDGKLKDEEKHDFDNLIYSIKEYFNSK